VMSASDEAASERLCVSRLRCPKHDDGNAAGPSLIETLGRIPRRVKLPCARDSRSDYAAS
jgi:hypothetical protein